MILAIISRGATIEAKSAEQVNGLIAKLEKGASVTFLLRRGEQQFFSTIKLGAARVGCGVELTLLVRAYCHLVRRNARCDRSAMLAWNRRTSCA